MRDIKKTKKKSAQNKYKLSGKSLKNRGGTKLSDLPQDVRNNVKPFVKAALTDITIKNVVRIYLLKEEQYKQNKSHNMDGYQWESIAVSMANHIFLKNSESKRVLFEKLPIKIQDEIAEELFKSICNTYNIFLEETPKFEKQLLKYYIIKTFGHIENWDVSKVKNMSYLFSGLNNFNLPIGNWDTSNVTNMRSMFEDTVFNQDIGGWDTSNVTDMSSMFKNNNEFDKNIGQWDTSSVTDMSAMFQSKNFNQDIGTFFTTKKFNQDIGTWNTNKVNNMEYMFYGATNFDQNIERWDTSNVTDVTKMFDDSGVKLNNSDDRRPEWYKRRFRI
jgi:surface protein